MSDIPREEIEKLRDGWNNSLKRMEAASLKNADNLKMHETHKAFCDGSSDQLFLCIEDLDRILKEQVSLKRH